MTRLNATIHAATLRDMRRHLVATHASVRVRRGIAESERGPWLARLEREMDALDHALSLMGEKVAA